MFAPDDGIVAVADFGNNRLLIVPDDGGAASEVGLKLNNVDVVLDDAV